MGHILSVVIFILGISSGLRAVPAERKLYFSSNASEARMKFEFRVEMSAPRAPTPKEAREKIDAQLQHLFGTMAAHPKYKGVPKGKQQITLLKVEPGEGNLFTAHYRYDGIVLLQNGPKQHHTITLPINPDTVYERGTLIKGNKRTYPCTDDHYYEEGDFWYFWDPTQGNCPLVEGTDYENIKVGISWFPNTVRTFPEYRRLADENGVISIHVLVGMDEATRKRNPLTSDDIHAQGYRQVRRDLKKIGFGEDGKWSTEEVRVITGSSIPTSELPYVETLSKQGKRAKIVVRMFYGQTGFYEKSKAFHQFFRDALANASVMMYDGHSGLGQHLDLREIELKEGFTFAPNQKRYQIYFFNSCSSYTYYGSMYFDRKITRDDSVGSKNLDILSSGLASYYNPKLDPDVSFIKAIDAWNEGKGTLNYQAIARSMEMEQLLGVNGDEDNPTLARDAE